MQKVKHLKQKGAVAYTHLHPQFLHSSCCLPPPHRPTSSVKRVQLSERDVLFRRSGSHASAAPPVRSWL